MVDLIDVPADIGKGGANLGDGAPKLAEILTRLTSAVAELQEGGGGGKTYLSQLAKGSSGAGPVSLPGALVGDVLISVTEANGVGLLDGSHEHNLAELPLRFETVITVNDQIQQNSTEDIHPISLLFFLQRG